MREHYLYFIAALALLVGVMNLCAAPEQDKAENHLPGVGWLMDVKGGKWRDHQIKIPPGVKGLEFSIKLMEPHLSKAWASSFKAGLANDEATASLNYHIKNDTAANRLELFRGKDSSDVQENLNQTFAWGDTVKFYLIWSDATMKADIADFHETAPLNFQPTMINLFVSGAKIELIDVKLIPDK